MKERTSLLTTTDLDAWRNLKIERQWSGNSLIPGHFEAKLSKIGTAHQASGLQIPQMLTLSWRGSLHKPSQNERKYNGHYDSYNQTIENLKNIFHELSFNDK